MVFDLNTIYKQTNIYMMKKITLLALLTISLSVFSQAKIKGTGNVSLIKTDLTAYNKLVINNDFRVVLIKSDNPSIEIETDDNLHDAIKVNVTDSIFTLNTFNKLKPKKTFNITIFYTALLDEITVNDDAQIETLNTLNVSNMTVNINNYAKTDLSIKSDTFNLNNNNEAKIKLLSKSKLNIESKLTNLKLAGSSISHVVIRTDSLNITLKNKASLEVEGTATKLNAIAQGNGDIKGKNLNIEEASIFTKDDTNLSAKITEKLLLESYGKSKVELYGNPVITLAKFTDSAKLHKKEFKKN